ncbi:uncharacterized protein LOC107273503 [Cephus cinctus]|uniref:Uncharacterized protein LOC107273503 n=1 Tax=Cephus cinctus TaxID=211228 RepID=A0AAJ7FTB2_CEPCN|nr:uncharacterized protein LOC107273503 [Cephus cinctus]
MSGPNMQQKSRCSPTGPKLRLHQSHCKQKSSAKAVNKLNGPRITNIETIKRPIRIVRSDDKDLQCAKSQSTNNDKIKSTMCKSKKTSVSYPDTETIPKVQTSKGGTMLKKSRDTDTTNGNLSSKILQSKKGEEGKENEEKKRPDENVPSLMKSSKKDSSNVSKGALPKVPTGKRSVLTWKHPSSKTFSSKGKACPKIAKPKTQQRLVEPVKKRVLRDITGHRTAVYIESEPSKLKLCLAPSSEKDPMPPDSSTHNDPGKTFERPEYNSIMRTIDELRDIRKEKFIIGMDSLPTVYKDLVNKKMSSSLDFPPDEAVFTDLIDLSINDKSLPSRLTRSKDPIPRQRDSVPKLSDFFEPEYAEEYCAAVEPRSRTPENVENWNAFSVSRKIFGWKQNLDADFE